MGQKVMTDVSGLGHPCPGSYLTPPDDTSVGNVCEEISGGPGRLLSCNEGPPAGRFPNQGGATLYGRGWDRKNNEVKKY